MYQICRNKLNTTYVRPFIIALSTLLREIKEDLKKKKKKKRRDKFTLPDWDIQ